LKLLPLFILFGSLLFPADADHLLLTRVVTQPDAAESFSIYNPTDNSINLRNYYICDDEEYYKMQTEGDMAPSHFLYGFTARFPNINIEPKNNIIGLFLKTESNSCIPAKRTKIKKNNKKCPPLTIKKIDKGKIINEVKILFSKLVIFYQNFFLSYEIYL